MKKLIEAGSGKIKKKRKISPIFTSKGKIPGMKSPFSKELLYRSRLASVMSSQERINEIGFRDAEFLENLAKDRIIFIDPIKPVEELFKDAVFKGYTEYTHFRFEIAKIPSFPQIELVTLGLPRYFGAHSSDQSDNPFVEANRGLLKSKHVYNMYPAIKNRKLNFLTLNIIFEHDDDNPSIRKGLFIPLMNVDKRIPDKDKDNYWNIYKVRHYAQPIKSELFPYMHCNHDLLYCKNGTYGLQKNMLASDDQFLHALEEAILEYGGKK